MIKSAGKLRDLTGLAWDRLASLGEAAGQQYFSFDTCVIARSTGAERWRHIDDPKADLKNVQRRVLKLVLPRCSLRPRMFGAKRGASIENHAATHLGRDAVLTVDLKNCFPMTRHRAVYRAWVTRYGCSPDLARVLTQLTTRNGSLPQGAPTSGYLAHVCLLDLFDELDAFSKARGLRLSFYMDDIAISGRRPVVAAACADVAQIIQAHGHSISGRKTRVMFGEDRILTGLKVEDARITVPEAYAAELERDLVVAARASQITANAYNSLQGRVAWLRRFAPARGNELARLLAFVDRGDLAIPVSPKSIPCKSRATCLGASSRRPARPPG